jgi:hypothetical protein
VELAQSYYELENLRGIINGAEKERGSKFASVSGFIGSLTQRGVSHFNRASTVSASDVQNVLVDKQSY